MKNLVLAVLAALVLAAALPTGAMAETTVTVTKFNQAYPHTGRATVEYTVGGTLPATAFAEITLRTDGASATFVQSNIVTGANSHVIDFASSFGGALVLSNASFVVRINPGDNDLGGVQLWENGPYWAECNVGASEPEECGYYFWWGDTVGYTRSGGTWDERTSRFYDVTWVSSTGEQMSNSPFPDSDSSPTTCPTMNKDNSTLQSEGWIDATTNLVAAHDAATAHLGAPWRMPTYQEYDDLINNCTTTWITNGVKGRLVTGTGAYANRSIFLPATGYGDTTNLYNTASQGYYWSSTPHPGRLSYAWRLHFTSKSFSQQYSNYRYYGQPVRPVRDFAGCSASGSVTYDSSPYETWAAANGVAGAWDATDASGIHNVFRYLFDVPAGAITNPPLLDNAARIEHGGLRGFGRGVERRRGRGGDAEEAARRDGTHRVPDGERRLSLLSPLGDGGGSESRRRPAVGERAVLGGVQRGCLGAGGTRLLLLVGRHSGLYAKRRNIGAFWTLHKRDMGVEHG